MLTEFGGIVYSGRPAPEETKLWGYALAQTDIEFLDRYRRLLAVANNNAVFSGFWYTQFADTFQEANGLLYADRTPKVPLELIAAATLKRSDVEIATYP